MKLLFVLEHFHPYIGGAEQLFAQLTSALVKNGYEVSVVTTRHRSDLPTKEVWKGVKIYRVLCVNRYFFTVLSLGRILQQARQCDFIHTTTYNAAIPAYLVGKLLNKKVIITFHEVWGKLWLKLPFIASWQKQLYYAFERLLLNLSFDRYIAVSNYTKGRLARAGIPTEKISMIYNGLDYQVFKNYRHIPTSNFTYTYFGRLGVSKGLDILLPAAQKFYATHPASQLILIIPKTPKSIFKRLINRIQQLQLEKHIIRLHNLSKPELYKTLCQSSCVVIPSYSEGFCFAAVEANALQVPIISSQKGALMEVVSGCYLPLETLDAKSLYEALLKAQKGEWKRLPIKKFKLEKTIQQYLNLYKGLLKEKTNG